MDIPQIMEENGKRYRMLQVGETIEEGDEVNVEREGWRKFDMTLNHIGGLPIPVVCNGDGGYMPVGFYRRPIQ